MNLEARIARAIGQVLSQIRSSQSDNIRLSIGTHAAADRYGIVMTYHTPFKVSLIAGIVKTRVMAALQVAPYIAGLCQGNKASPDARLATRGVPKFRSTFRTISSLRFNQSQ